MKLILASLLALTLAACAGGNADRDFRSKVQSVAVKGGVTSEARKDSASTSGTGEVDFTFRDPNKP